MAVITVYGKTPDVGSAALWPPTPPWPGMLCWPLAAACGTARWCAEIPAHPHWQKQQYPGQRRAAHRAKPGGNDRQKCIHRPQCSGAWLYGGGRRFDRYARHGDERRRGGQKCRGGRPGRWCWKTPWSRTAWWPWVCPPRCVKPPAPPWWKPTEKMPKGMWRKPPPMRTANK